MVKHILTLPVGFCKESQFPWKYFKPNQYPPQLGISFIQGVVGEAQYGGQNTDTDRAHSGMSHLWG